MQIDRIFVRLADPSRHSDPALKAFVTLRLAGAGLRITIDDIRIIRTAAGRLVLAWPNRKVRGLPKEADRPVYLDDDRQPYWHRDTVHPTDDATRTHIDAKVIAAYWAAVRLRLMDYEASGDCVTPRVASLAG